MKGFLISQERNFWGVVDVDMKTLDDLYRVLHCDIVERVFRTISGRIFQVWCDEEGALKQGQKLTALDDEGRVMFVGSIILFNSDGTDISAEDERFLTENVGYIVSRGEQKIFSYKPESYGARRLKKPAADCLKVFMPNDFCEAGSSLMFVSSDTEQLKTDLYYEADSRKLSDVVSMIRRPDCMLEDIYEAYNMHHPEGYENRSMSIGDIVAYTLDGETKVYYVDTFGFRDITSSFELDSTGIEIYPCLFRVG